MRVAFAILPVVAAVAMMPGAARSDVLEINGAGHGWVAGGPKAVVPADAATRAPDPVDTCLLYTSPSPRD